MLNTLKNTGISRLSWRKPPASACSASLRTAPLPSTAQWTSSPPVREQPPAQPSSNYLGVPAAVAHQQLCRTPLQTPILQPSHTSISFPLGSIDLCGNYCVRGPAAIKKVNNEVVAVVQPGGTVSMLCSHDNLTLLSAASISHDEQEPGLCHLVGHYLELEGSFIIYGQEHGIMHDGKVVVNVDHLPEDNCITLLSGGSISHPINVHPHCKCRC